MNKTNINVSETCTCVTLDWQKKPDIYKLWRLGISKYFHKS